MPTVWVVIEQPDIETTIIHGVFSSEIGANRYISEQSARKYFYAEEFTVDIDLPGRLPTY